MRQWLYFLFAPLFAYETAIESSTAHYDGSTITLNGSVHVENEMGELFAERAILIKDEAKQTRIDFPWVELIDEVHFSLEGGRELRCAHAYLDYTQLTSRIEGGPIAHYRDTHGEVFAKRAVIDYREEERELKPCKVTLFEDVRMENRAKGQYALADIVEYYPDKELMILKGGPVLFFDKNRGVELSAREVHARRDEEGRESVKGVGNVHFLFGASEMEKLQEKFRW